MSGNDELYREYGRVFLCRRPKCGTIAVKVSVQHVPGAVHRSKEKGKLCKSTKFLLWQRSESFF